tara:strand:- start:18 stop:236 length:219 start_codon:yes stop_codon:yes gene_type:complete
MTPINKLIDMYGTATKAGLAIGLKRQVIEHWVKNGYIPHKKATYVQTKTGGAITNIKIWLAADRAKHTNNGD